MCVVRSLCPALVRCGVFFCVWMFILAFWDLFLSTCKGLFKEGFFFLLFSLVISKQFAGGVG